LTHEGGSNCRVGFGVFIHKVADTVFCRLGCVAGKTGCGGAGGFDMFGVGGADAVDRSLFPCQIGGGVIAADTSGNHRRAAIHNLHEHRSDPRPATGAMLVR